MISADVLKQKRDLEQKFNNSVMLSELGPVHSIYFDLPLLQDVYIGTLLLHTQTKEEYYEIIRGIPYYLSRIDNNITPYFNTKLTDEDIYNFIKDPQNGELLFKASPHTTLWVTMEAFIGMIIEKNRVVDSGDFHCDIFVNTVKVNYPPKVYKWMSNVLKSISSHLTLKTVSLPIDELPTLFRTSIDLFFLEDVSPFFSTNEELIKEMCHEQIYSDKHFYTRRAVTAETTKDLETVFDKTYQFCNIFTQFHYLELGIPGVQYIPSIVNPNHI